MTKGKEAYRKGAVEMLDKKEIVQKILILLESINDPVALDKIYRFARILYLN